VRPAVHHLDPGVAGRRIAADQQGGGSAQLVQAGRFGRFTIAGKGKQPIGGLLQFDQFG